MYNNPLIVYVHFWFDVNILYSLILLIIKEYRTFKVQKMFEKVVLFKRKLSYESRKICFCQFLEFICLIMIS